MRIIAATCHYDSWTNAVVSWSAKIESSQSLRVAMRLSHDTSTPFPASHSLRTSIAISTGSSRALFLMLAILFPRSSFRRMVPNAVTLGPTHEGSLILIKQLWGIVDVYGRCTKIKSELLHCESGIRAGPAIVVKPTFILSCEIRLVVTNCTCANAQHA